MSDNVTPADELDHRRVLRHDKQAKAMVGQTIQTDLGPMPLIAAYTASDAVADGLVIHLVGKWYCTPGARNRLAGLGDGPWPTDPESVDRVSREAADRLAALRTRYDAGDYFDPGATDYPEEADRGLASYLVDNAKLWIMDNGVTVTVLLPEEY